MPLTPEQRTLRAKMAAHTQHARGRTNTGPARKAFERRFEDEVDPNRELPEDERRRRAYHAMKAHMTRLSFQAAKARKQQSLPRADH